VGVSRLDDAAQQDVQRRDWEQYSAWFER
jgi:hypothetical protein